MKARELLDFLSAIETLKTIPRHCVTRGGAPESVAAHCWRLGVMALLVAEEFDTLDMDRVLRMCLIHDFGEAVTGDIPAFEKTDGDVAAEQSAMDGLLNILPEPQQDMLRALFCEMDAQQTKEARLYKALDKLEAVIQHNESDISTWIPLEYQLNRTYATENAEEFPFLKALREEMRMDTEKKIQEAEKQ